MQKTSSGTRIKKITFEGDDGREYVASFTEENGLPVSAIIHDSRTGKADHMITYRYDSHFFAGRLPVEISSYSGSVVDEKFKFFVIQIRSLKISNRHLPLAEIDPDKFITTTNPDYMPLFYSNNILYWTDARGGVRPVRQK
jgi:hypothetical protein